MSNSLEVLVNAASTGVDNQLDFQSIVDAPVASLRDIAGVRSPMTARKYMNEYSQRVIDDICEFVELKETELAIPRQLSRPHWRHGLTVINPEDLQEFQFLAGVVNFSGRERPVVAGFEFLRTEHGEQALHDSTDRVKLLGSISICSSSHGSDDEKFWNWQAHDNLFKSYQVFERLWQDMKTLSGKQ